MKMVSGIRPTGQIHLGNYLGAIQQWIPLQEKSECLFFIADLHALTTNQGDDIKTSSYNTAAVYLACGIEPGSIFVQSHVHEHAELGWILSCHTPLGWLHRMTQFKEKGENQDKAALGLLAYPALMAADVLLYDATHVPVGEDQKQHVELIRDIALSMNHHYKSEIFTVPEPLIQKVGARIMSLRDGSAKMGKSNTSDFERINLWDTDDMIVNKIKKATTDAYPMPSILSELDERKEVKNLLTIYSLASQKSLEESIAEFSGQGFAPFKTALADAIVALIAPIRTKMLAFQNDKGELDRILKEGALKAQATASKKMSNVFNSVKLG